MGVGAVERAVSAAQGAELQNAVPEVRGQVLALQSTEGLSVDQGVQSGRAHVGPKCTRARAHGHTHTVYMGVSETSP